jgi:hypothetical protein
VVKDLIVRSSPVRAFSISELADLGEVPPDESFRSRVVRPLARQGILTPVGVPFDEQENGRLVELAEPFLPSYKLIHRALAELVGA